MISRAIELDVGPASKCPLWVISGHCARSRRCPLCATSGLTHCNKHQAGPFPRSVSCTSLSSAPLTNSTESIADPSWVAKLLDCFFHIRRQVSPPVNNLTHRFFDGCQPQRSRLFFQQIATANSSSAGLPQQHLRTRSIKPR